MAYGPDKTKPPGSTKREMFEVIERKIDNIIYKTEGSTVYVCIYDIPDSAKYYQEEIADIYKRAGWLYAYWAYRDKGYCEDVLCLVLSNDMFHVMPVEKEKSEFSWKEFFLWLFRIKQGN